MQIPIVTKEAFKDFTDEDIDFYLNGPCFEDELRFAVYKTIREALDDNDTGDLGFPEIFISYLQENHKEQLDLMWDRQSRPDYQKMLDWLQEDEERDDALCVFTVKQVYKRQFYYDGLMRYVAERPDVVVCNTKDEWLTLHMQDELA